MSNSVYEAEAQLNQRSTNIVLTADNIFRDCQAIVLARGRDDPFRNYRKGGIHATILEECNNLTASV